MIPIEAALLAAPRVTVKLDLGSLPVPRLWKGPPNPIEIGLRRVRDPDGVRVRATLSVPLFTLWLPLNVSRSSFSASPEELLPPHPVAKKQAAKSGKSAPRRNVLARLTIGRKRM
jgi:hypothetical protein